LIEQIGRSWETTHQTRFRLQWLAACDIAERSGQKWKLA
jgi:hypothetical protein